MSTGQHDRAERFVGFFMQRPFLTGALLIGLTAAGIVSMLQLEIESGVTPFFNPERQERKVLDAIEDKFVSDELIFVTYETDDVFRTERLATIRALTGDLEKLKAPGPKGRGEVEVDAVKRVTSLTNVKEVVGRDMSYQALPLVGETLPQGRDEEDRIRKRARGNQLIREGLLGRSSDRAGAMLVQLVDDLDDPQKAAIVESVRTLVQSAEKQTGMRFFLSGEVVANAETAAEMKRDLALFLPVVYGIVLLLLFIFVRRVTGVALAMVNVTIALVVGMGALKWVGGSINNLSTAIPPVMMVLSVAAIVHFLSELARHAREHHDPAQRTLAELLPAQFMCAVTTAVGFGSLAVAPIPALREFGLASATAVLLAMPSAFFLAVLASRGRHLSTYVAPESAALSKRQERWVSWCAEVVVKHPWPLLVVGSLVCLLAVAGIFRIRADENILENFGKDAPIVQAITFTEENMGGTVVATISIKGKAAGAFEDPDALRRLDALGDFLRKEADMDLTTSLADYVKLMHWGFNDEAPQALRIPDTKEQVAQLLLLNNDDTLNDFVDTDHQWVRLVARSRQHSSTLLGLDFEKVDAYLATHFPPDRFEAVATGGSRLWVLMVADLMGSQTGSLGTSFILIFLPIFILFRSVRAGLFSIPSNIFPVILSLGMMGWFGIPLNTATTMSASIVLGIAVDDTIHFILHARSRLAAHGDLERAIRETFAMKSGGVVWTLLIITLGFGVLTLSNFKATSNFGFLTAAAMITGAIGEFLILPPLMLVTKTRLGVDPPRGSPASSS